MESCQVQPTGCTDWSSALLCAPGEICSGGKCTDTCTNQCLTGTWQCAGTGGIQACKEQSTGCTDWDTAIPCPEGSICSGGQCSDTCTNQCEPNKTRCSIANEVQICEIQPSGCSEWVTEQSCSDGEVCSEGACISKCTDECTAASQTCGEANDVRTCQTGPDGCMQWGAGVACPAETTCVLGKCTPGSTDWQQFDGVTHADLFDVWAAHAGAVWAVGTDATVLFFDGNIWRSQDVGAASGARMRCVHGTSARNVYAVSETGEVYRFDGTSWQFKVDMHFSGGYRESACVAAVSTDLAYGIHWDGRKATLYSIDGETSDALMTWETLYPGVDGSAQVRSFSLAVVGPGHLWLTDQYLRAWKDDRLHGLDRDSGIKSYARLFMLPDGQAWMSNGSTGRHYDGSRFRTVNPGAGGLINDFAGTAPNRIFAVGQYDNDTRSGFARKYDGLGWQALTLPDDTPTLMAAWAFSSGEVILVGRQGEILWGRP